MQAKNTNIEFRASTVEKAQIKRAAKTLGLDLSSFLRMVALREASRIEAERSGLSITDKDREFLLESLEGDPEPNPKLVDLFAKYTH